MRTDDELLAAGYTKEQLNAALKAQMTDTDPVWGDSVCPWCHQIGHPVKGCGWHCIKCLPRPANRKEDEPS